MYKSIFATYAILSTVSGLAVKRDDTQNVHVEVGDTVVNWGNQTPWDVLNTLKDHCQGIGCDGEWDVPTQFIANGELVSGHITVKALDATFRDDDSVKEGIIEVLKETQKAVHTEEEMEYVKDRCYDPSCQTTNHPTITKVMQYKAPALVTLRTEHADDQSVIDNVRVEVSITIDDQFAGFCDAIDVISGAGGVVAGAVNGWLGLPFAFVGSLICI